MTAYLNASLILGPVSDLGEMAACPPVTAADLAAAKEVVPLGSFGSGFSLVRWPDRTEVVFQAGFCSMVPSDDPADGNGFAMQVTDLVTVSVGTISPRA